MTEFLGTWMNATWHMLLASGLLLLIGFGLAGLVRMYLNERMVHKYLGAGGAKSVFAASLLGVPLPLCSCSVLPVAYQLRRAGLSKGATVSFLISTPETGVDSILLTWSLTDPLMTVARPITAFVTAVVAGLTEERLDSRRRTDLPIAAASPGDCCHQEAPPVPVGSCCHERTAPTPISGCCHEKAAPIPIAKSCCHDETPPSRSVFPQRLREAFSYAYSTLLRDLAPYLLVGYLLAGLVATVWGGDSGRLPSFLTHGWGAYAGAIIIGLPLYICATSSTPLAAALMGLGFPAGAALVFLMVGPATNAASLAVITRILSRRETIRYLLSIVIVAVLCGLALDWLYGALGLEPRAIIPGAHSHHPGWPATIAASLLAVGILWHGSAAALRKLRG